MANRGVIVVTGAGGFVGGHLVAFLRQSGAKEIRAADIKPLDQWHQVFPDVRNFSGPLEGDCRDFRVCRVICRGAGEVYQLAADMGGMGYIENNKALCMLSVAATTQMLLAAQEAGADRFFFPSSTCVYNAEKQADPRVTGLREEDAYPALPEDGYGWEKLFSERLCRHFREDFGLGTRVARFHNVYGPFGAWEGGRERAPAAICRKVIAAVVSGRHEIEIWGDGTQTRSFMYVDDCVKGVDLIAHSDLLEPVNLGSGDLVSINRLVDVAEEIAGVKLKRRYKLDAPRGVAGRNSDNTRIRAALGWEPGIPLRDGMEKTYRWIYDEFTARYNARTAAAGAVSLLGRGSRAFPGGGCNPETKGLDTWSEAIPAVYGAMGAVHKDSGKRPDQAPKRAAKGAKGKRRAGA